MHAWSDKSLTRDQVRAADRFAIEFLHIPGAILMENAGRNAADIITGFITDGLSQPPGASVAIVAGAGNNGGDGFVIARHLRLKGFRPEIFLVADENKIRGDAKINFDIVRAIGLQVHKFSDAEKIALLGQSLSKFELVVDAVGGTGIVGTLRNDISQAVEQMNLSGRPIVALDIPTGLDCDTGLPLGPTVLAAMTVTFVARKIGFDSPSAEKYTGKVIVADIGIPPELICHNEITRQ